MIPNRISAAGASPVSETSRLRVKGKQVKGLCDPVTVCGMRTPRGNAVTEKLGRPAPPKAVSQETCRLPVRERNFQITRT